ncbi:MAG TPA: outer membrane beta-barrel protein [Candidatus Acidoferrales bacterium]|jgi:outer membrane immunogenic protein
MKKLALAFSILAISSIGASAADLPMKAAPYVASPPVFSWTGFYIGGNVGAGIMLDQGFVNSNIVNDRHGIGGLGGGQIGYNWQIGQLVLGIEGEGFWSGMRVTQDQFVGINPGTLFATATIKNKWDWDIAGRFGLAFNRALVYGKAGWVQGGFQWDQTFTFGTEFITANHNLDGLLIGIGLEYAVDNNWTVKFEYDYLGFPAKDLLFTAGCATCVPVTLTQNVSADKHIFKVGFNYLFNWGAAPIVAKY